VIGDHSARTGCAPLAFGRTDTTTTTASRE